MTYNNLNQKPNFAGILNKMVLAIVAKLVILLMVRMIFRILIVINFQKNQINQSTLLELKHSKIFKWLLKNSFKLDNLDRKNLEIVVNLLCKKQNNILLFLLI